MSIRIDKEVNGIEYKTDKYINAYIVNCFLNIFINWVGKDFLR